jgi:hypothetical protein
MQGNYLLSLLSLVLFLIAYNHPKQLSTFFILLKKAILRVIIATQKSLNADIYY